MKVRIALSVIFLLTDVLTCFGQSLPFKLHGGYLIVTRCSVGNLSDLTAIIDTGASETVIDIALARRLGLEMRPDIATYVTGDGQVQAVSIPDVHLGSLQASSLAGIAIDLSGVVRAFGVHPDLLIGMDLLHRSNFTIDYRARLISFGPAPLLAHTAVLQQGSRLALVQAHVSGKPIRLQIDTGFAGLLIYQDHLPPASAFPEIGEHVVGVSQKASVQGESLDFELGNWRARNLTASVVADRSSAREFGGLLGARVLASHHISFDFDRMTISWD